MKIKLDKCTARFTVRDLIGFLQTQNPDAIVLLSDGHEGCSQIRPSAGLIPNTGYSGYVVPQEELEEYLEDSEDDTDWSDPIPAIQLDTGV